MTLLDEWVEKAETNWKAATALNRPRKEPLPDVVCFHCQQSAEKYLKAYLIVQSVVPARTHDLVDLLVQCAGYDAALSAYLPLARALDPYSVRFRYPGVTATVADAQDAVKAMRQLRRKLGL